MEYNPSDHPRASTIFLSKSQTDGRHYSAFVPHHYTFRVSNITIARRLQQTCSDQVNWGMLGADLLLWWIIWARKCVKLSKPCLQGKREECLLSINVMWESHLQLVKALGAVSAFHLMTAVWRMCFKALWNHTCLIRCRPPDKISKQVRQLSLQQSYFF